MDGWALEIVLKHYRKAFTELAILSRTAICCRVTPSQKAQVLFDKFFVLVIFLFDGSLRYMIIKLMRLF